jgi:hypothetical protein
LHLALTLNYGLQKEELKANDKSLFASLSVRSRPALLSTTHGPQYQAIHGQVHGLRGNAVLTL